MALSMLIKKVADNQFRSAINKWVNEVISKLVHVDICTPSQLLHAISTGELNPVYVKQTDCDSITSPFESSDEASKKVPPPLSPSEIKTIKDVFGATAVDFHRGEN